MDRLDLELKLEDIFNYVKEGFLWFMFFLAIFIYLILNLLTLGFLEDHVKLFEDNGED